MPDTGAALEHISTYPVIYILEQSMSTKWVTVELVLIVALVLFANVCYITAVSRDLWAFARDNGVPFSPWVCKVCDGQRETFRWADLLTIACADPSQVPCARQRNLRDRALFFLAESHLHRLRNSFLRHYVPVHGCALAMLHVFHRLDPMASHIFARHDTRI